MKKNFIFLGLLATSLAFAQSGKVGVNTSNPEATLDIKPSAANAATTATTNEGVLIPRVSKARLNSIATTNLKESTLVYVDNISGTTNPVTSNVTSKGFYYYSTTDSKWVKIAEGTTQEQDLRLVGNDHHITQDGGKGGNGTSAGNGRNNLAIGKNTLFSITGGSNNIAMGEGALYTNTVGPQNIALGNNALYSNQWGAWNIAVGIEALYSNQGGTANVAIGHNALRNGTGGVGNIAIGWDALMAGGNGIAIGSQALSKSQSGYNLAIGYGALKENTTGIDNVALGNGALVSNTTASNNVAVGASALATNTTGASNVAVGTNTLRYNTTGNNNVGIGSGVMLSNTTGYDNIGMGAGALLNNTIGNSNIALGTNSLRTNTTGKDNIAMGTSALFANTTGVNNIAIGSNGLRFNTTGSNNISFGTNTLLLNTTGERNIAIGDGTLSGNTLGAYNIGLGISVLNSNTTGKLNIVLVTNSLSANISGDSNIGIGNSVLLAKFTGTNNIAIGHYPLSKVTASHNNIALGYKTLENNTYGNYNIALGTSALSSNTTGQHNNAQGVNALKNNVTGSSNIAFGHGAGEWIKSDYNVHIGNASFPPINTTELENVIVIGNGINASDFNPSTGKDDAIILGYKNGHNRSPNVGIGTYKPDSKVHIVTNGPNAIKIQDTNQAAGRVLTSDANGVGTWKDIELFKGAPAVGRFTWNAGVRLGNSRWNKIASVVVKPGTNMVFVKLHILSSQVPNPTKAYTRVYVGLKDVGTNNGFTNEKPIYTMFHPYLEHDYEFVGNFIYNNNTNSYQTLYLNLQSDVPNIIRSAFEYNTSASQVYGTTWYENWFYSVPVN